MSLSWSRLSQFVLGFTLAIALLFLAGAGMTRYLLTRLSTPPPRPSFTNDPSPSPVTNPANPTASPASPASPAATANPSPNVAVASPSPAASPSPSPSPQGYQGRVTQPIGLIVRQQPSVDAPRVGGVEFNSQVTVLEDNADGSWQRIRAGSVEGWVKGGNVQRVN